MSPSREAIKVLLFELGDKFQDLRLEEKLTDPDYDLMEAMSAYLEDLEK